MSDIIAALKFRKYAYLCLGDSFLSGTPVAGSANENSFHGCQSLILWINCCISSVTILDCILIRQLINTSRLEERIDLRVRRHECGGAGYSHRPSNVRARCQYNPTNDDQVPQ